jgi:hypothetical protein
MDGNIMVLTCFLSGFDLRSSQIPKKILKIKFVGSSTRSQHDVYEQSQRKSEEMRTSTDRSNCLRYLSKGSERKYIFTLPLSYNYLLNL